MDFCRNYFKAKTSLTYPELGLMNEELDEIHRAQYKMEKDINKRKVLKGTRYLLLRNGEDIFDKENRTGIVNALEMNKPLSQYTISKSNSERYGHNPKKQMPRRSCMIGYNRRERAKCRS